MKEPCCQMTWNPFIWFHSAAVVSSSNLSLLTSIDFLVTNCSCSFYTAQTKNKAFVQLTDEFFLIHHQIDNIKMGIVFYMKIRTFLQIVRSGKITASQKANLSINKKVVTHEFKICIEHNMLFRLIDKYSPFNQRFFEGFEFTDNLEGLCQVSLLAVFNFLRWIYICMNIENRTSCYICKTNILFLPNTQGANLPTYWQTCHFLEVNIFVTFKKQSVPEWGHNFFRKEQINPKSLFPHSKNK